MAGAAANDHGRGSREYRIKAAFIYELTKATQWPRDTGARLVLCVRGNDPFGAAWDTVEGRRVGTRQLHVRHLVASADVRGCHALFLGPNQHQWWVSASTDLAKQPVLTISEMAGFSGVGGMVTMMNVNNRLRFDINLKAVQAAGLKINTDALELANMIHAYSARP